MIALDTNVLARFLLRDDEAQYKAAAALLTKARHYTTPPTVLIELVWVLESTDCDRATIAHALRLLFNLPNFEPLEFDAVLRALNGYEAGMDFADAMHLALSGKAKAESFITSDKAFAKRAKKEEAYPPIELL
ncbi:MAG: type II toxin-antitoxin system VapC family toxin [Azonexus sp.]|nr:type II toxin-antitoxin system VapC family toxin [Azonexus sp.]